MKITKINIERFRGFSKQEFEAGSPITTIAGQNGTQKSTILGIITQTFTISGSNPMYGESPLCGGNYRSAFSDKFRLSPVFDKPKEHKWTLFFDDRQEFEVESIKRLMMLTYDFGKRVTKVDEVDIYNILLYF